VMPDTEKKGMSSLISLWVSASSFLGRSLHAAVWSIGTQSELIWDFTQ
jgi:hypothetical protein